MPHPHQRAALISSAVVLLSLLALPVSALECANSGTAPATSPDDTGDGTATACGDGAVADGVRSTALGALADASGNFSIALGPSASAGGTDSTALGPSASSVSNSGTALGHVASSVGASSVAVGAGASSGGENSSALGLGASSAGLSSTALGALTLSEGNDSTALGILASSGGNGSIAVGREASSVGNDSIALGRSASSAGTQSIALGRSASTVGGQSVALGISATSVGNQSTALGFNAFSGGTASIALGNNAGSAGDGSVALGQGAFSGGSRSSALGYRASSPNPDTIVLGQIPGVGFGSTYVSLANGTTDPLAPLHIFRDDATQEMLLLESDEAGGPQDRAMMFLANNGGIRFEFANNSLATSWRFQAATGSQDRFEVTKVGTGQIEFWIDDLGNGFIAGDLDVGGSLLTNVLLPSDRDLKTRIEAIDPATVLDKVASLPMNAWEYRDQPGVRHIGPMAQDFQAAFGLGRDDTSISVVDASGVALASIQALEKRNAELEAGNADLQQQLGAMREELDQVKALVMQLLPQTARH